MTPGRPHGQAARLERQEQKGQEANHRSSFRKVGMRVARAKVGWVVDGLTSSMAMEPASAGCRVEPSNSSYAIAARAHTNTRPTKLDSLARITIAGLVEGQRRRDAIEATAETNSKT